MIDSFVQSPPSPIATDRVIGSYSSDQSGPLVLAVGGIHGNEPSGILGIQSVFEKLLQHRPALRGRFVGIAGNLPALAKHTRFIDEDLNRCFCRDRVAEVQAESRQSAEEEELRSLLATIGPLASDFEDVCFIDCHTTSSETVPYISVNAHPPSLQLGQLFPLHNVIGLEQCIPGCFGEYCNELDYRGFTFEAGQHDSLASIENQEAAIWLLLVFSGALDSNQVERFDHYQQLLRSHIIEGRRSFRLAAHYRIAKDEAFAMEPGFVNFSKVSKGQLLARNCHGEIRSNCNGRILMPLYQKQGDDGYFLLKEE